MGKGPLHDHQGLLTPVISTAIVLLEKGGMIGMISHGMRGILLMGWEKVMESLKLLMQRPGIMDNGKQDLDMGKGLLFINLGY